jgi:hypothetical protein
MEQNFFGGFQYIVIGTYAKSKHVVALFSKSKEDIKYKLLDWLKHQNKYMKNRKLKTSTASIIEGVSSEYVNDILKIN